MTTGIRLEALAIMILMSVQLSGPAHAKELIVDECSKGCSLSGNWADNKGNNPDGANFSTAGLVGGTQHYTSSHGKYARTGKETAVFTAKLPTPGKYEVSINWRRSSNRSSKVTWEVRHSAGTTRKIINQRGSTESIEWHSLGTYSFDKEGIVAMVDDGGQSASVDAARFSPASGGGTSDPGNDATTTSVSTSTGTGSGSGSGNLDDVLSGNGGSSAVVDGNNPGTKVFTFPEDGSWRVSALLRTRGPARLSVTRIATDGSKTPWLEWSRENDLDPAQCSIEGKAVPESMFEQNPGDFSPREVARSIRGKKGESLVLSLEGDFQGEVPYLKVEAE